MHTYYVFDFSKVFFRSRPKEHFLILIKYILGGGVGESLETKHDWGSLS